MISTGEGWQIKLIESFQTQIQMSSSYFQNIFHNRLLIGLPGLLLLLACTTNVFSQTPASKKIKAIESIASRIDSDKTFATAISEGSSEDEAGFSFCFYIYYRKELKTVSKATYSCDTTFKTFYYKNNKLVKIITDGNSYYYIQNTLYAVDGTIAGKPFSDELLELSNVPLKGIEDFFKRMGE